MEVLINGKRYAQVCLADGYPQTTPDGQLVFVDEAGKYIIHYRIIYGYWVLLVESWDWAWGYILHRTLVQNLVKCIVALRITKHNGIT